MDEVGKMQGNKAGRIVRSEHPNEDRTHTYTEISNIEKLGLKRCFSG